MNPDFDFVVVGGSLAGCTAATLLGRAGFRVLVLEREPSPAHYKKLCTHFLQPSALPTLKRLGLTDEMERQGAVRSSFQIRSPYGWVPAASTEAEEYGYNFPRRALDPMVRELARATPNVELRTGVPVRGLLRENGRVVGVTLAAPQGGEERVTARAVIAADGRNGKCAEWADVPTRVEQNNRFGYYAFFAGLPRDEHGHSRGWLHQDGALYTLPNPDGTSLVAAYLPKSRLEGFKKNVEQSFLELFDSVPDGPPLREAKRVGEFMGILEINNVIRKAAVPGLALVGDAALAPDPLWGIGCGWAFQSAGWLADCLAEAASDRTRIDAALVRYRRTHRAKLGGHFFMVADFGKVRPLNVFERLFMKASLTDQRSADHLQSFIERRIGLFRFLSPGPVARALSVLLTQGGKPRLLVPGAAPSALSGPSALPAHPERKAG